MIVIDASVAVKWYAPEEGHHAALELINDRDVLIAPDVIAYELLNALRQKLKRNEITPKQFDHAPELLFKAVRRFVPASSLVSAAASLSLSLDHPIYDCADTACAQRENAMLVTADTRFMRKIIEHGLGHLARLLIGSVEHPAS